MPRPLTRVLRFFLFMLLSAGCCSRAAAQAVTFTFTGTADTGADAVGYTLGGTYTFTLTTGPSYPALSSLSTSTFSGTLNNWNEEVASDSPLFEAVGGTGLLGSYVRPVTSSTDPDSYIYHSASYIEFQVGNEAAYSMGLTTLDSTPIKRIFVSPNFTSFTLNPGPVFPATFTDPAAYFNARVGVDSVSSTTLSLRNTSNIVIATFSITQIEIASAIPEPGTYAGLAGLCALVFAARNRRRR